MGFTIVVHDTLAINIKRDYNIMERTSTSVKVIRIIILIGVIIWAAVTLNTGFYVDENGLLVTYKGIYQGQHMFTDSWESLQTGGFLVKPLIALYYQAFKPLFLSTGINVGLVLYMRIAYMVLRGLVALYLYFTVKSTCYEDGAFLAAIFYFMFVVTWKNFSYKSICELAVMMLICFLIRFHATEKVRYFVLASIVCCVAILAYPTMIILAVAVGVWLIVQMYFNQIGNKPLIAFVITCVVIGAIFLIYLQSTTGVSQAFSELKYLGDQDYEHGAAYRVGYLLGSYAAVAVIAYIPIVCICLFRRARYLSDYTEHLILTIYWVVFFLGICLARPQSVSNSRFIYACLILYFWFPYFVHERSENDYTRIGAYNSDISDVKGVLWPIFIVSSATQFVWILSTNQDISVPGHMAVFVVIADILVMTDDEKYMRGLNYIIVAIAAFFMGFWVPEGNGGYADVTQKRWIVVQGELKGIALLPDDYDRNEAIYNMLSENVGPEDKLLVAFGSNSTGYLNTVGQMGTYSVYARTQKNTKLLDFYQLHPERQADYLLIDQANSKYEDFVAGETGQYLLETYTEEVASQGDLVLLKRGDAN